MNRPTKQEIEEKVKEFNIRESTLLERLLDFRDEAKALYDLLEPHFKQWRQKKQPDYEMRILQKAQESCIRAHIEVRQLVGVIMHQEEEERGLSNDGKMS